MVEDFANESYKVQLNQVCEGKDIQKYYLGWFDAARGSAERVEPGLGEILPQTLSLLYLL